MKHIKGYNQIFENESGLSQEQIEFLDAYSSKRWEMDRTTGLVNVYGDFDCSNIGLTNFMGIRFGKVNNNFECHHNELRTLEGAPRKVGGNFWCSKNSLHTLKGAPLDIGGSFRCSENRLTTLEGAPQRVDGYFLCYKNNLKSLEGAPRMIGGYFYLREGSDDAFEWTTQGKFEYLESYPEDAGLILPTIPFKEMVGIIQKNSILLTDLEKSDKDLYDKVLKELGWDKMGPDLLKQLKDGIY